MIKIINKYSNIGKVLLISLLITISFSLFIFNCSLLYARDTIIDSVYATPELDGRIHFSQNNQTLEVNNWYYAMFAGDTGDSMIPDDPNSLSRSYISFELPEFPEGYELDSVFVRLYQFYCVGDGDIVGNSEPFPLFFGQEYPCIMDHIDYGNQLDVSDWTKGDPGDPGTLHTDIGCISDNGLLEYKYLDITGYVQDDYENDRNKTQYRIRFQILTDWDNLYDNLGFKTCNSTQIHQHPIIVLYFNANNSAIDNTVFKSDCLRIYPNPFNPSSAGRSPGTTISYDLPVNIENVVLEIFNIKGEKVRELLIVSPSPNHQVSVTWDGKDYYRNPVASGVYLCRIKADNLVSKPKKMILMK